MTRVAIVGQIHPAGVERLAAAGLTTVAVDERDDQAIGMALREAEAVIVRTAPITAAAIAAAPQLRIVAKHGVGVDNIAVGALTERRIPCAIAANANNGR